MSGENGFDKARRWFRSARQTADDFGKEAHRWADETGLKGHYAELGEEARRSCKEARERIDRFAAEHPGRVKGGVTGVAAGIAVGAALGGGAVGIVALGTGIGIPLVAITGLTGLIAGERAGRELDIRREQRQQLQEQQQRAATREAAAQEAAARENRPALPPPDGVGIEWVRDEDHCQALQAALADARRSLCIRSGFLSEGVVHKDFADAISALLQRGVDVYLEYGPPIGSAMLSQGTSFSNAEANLRAVKREARANNHIGKFAFGRTFTHIKEIAVDDRYAIIGSFNWLSDTISQKNNSSVKIWSSKLAREVLHDTEQSLAGLKIRL